MSGWMYCSTRREHSCRPHAHHCIAGKRTGHAPMQEREGRNANAHWRLQAARAARPPAPTPAQRQDQPRSSRANPERGSQGRAQGAGAARSGSTDLKREEDWAMVGGQHIFSNGHTEPGAAGGAAHLRRRRPPRPPLELPPQELPAPLSPCAQVGEERPRPRPEFFGSLPQPRRGAAGTAAGPSPPAQRPTRLLPSFLAVGGCWQKAGSPV